MPFRSSSSRCASHASPFDGHLLAFINNPDVWSSSGFGLRNQGVHRSFACARFANNAAAEGTLDRRVAGSLFIRCADACPFSRRTS